MDRSGASAIGLRFIEEQFGQVAQSLLNERSGQQSALLQMAQAVIQLRQTLDELQRQIQRAQSANGDFCDAVHHLETNENGDPVAMAEDGGFQQEQKLLLAELVLAKAEVDSLELDRNRLSQHWSRADNEAAESEQWNQQHLSHCAAQFNELKRHTDGRLNALAEEVLAKEQTIAQQRQAMEELKRCLASAEQTHRENCVRHREKVAQLQARAMRKAVEPPSEKETLLRHHTVLERRVQEQGEVLRQLENEHQELLGCNEELRDQHAGIEAIVESLQGRVPASTKELEATQHAAAERTVELRQLLEQKQSERSEWKARQRKDAQQQNAILGRLLDRVHDVGQKLWSWDPGTIPLFECSQPTMCRLLFQADKLVLNEVDPWCMRSIEDARRCLRSLSEQFNLSVLLNGDEEGEGEKADASIQQGEGKLEENVSLEATLQTLLSTLQVFSQELNARINEKRSSM